MNDQIKAVLNEHNLTVESVFIPFSQSRNAGEKNPSLNWKVTLKQKGKNILTTDYSAGCAHAPSYKQSFKRNIDNERMVYAECEYGGEAQHTQTMDYISVPNSKKGTLKPNEQDVIYSLLMDSDVLEYACFEDWADSFGYSVDSRAHEKIYNACLKNALQFRKIGETAIAELREAYQDY